MTPADMSSEPQVWEDAEPVVVAEPPAAPTFPEPPLSRNPARAVNRPAFLLKRPLVDAYFIRRSEHLIVTFDNLNSVGQHAPAQPWLQMRAARADLSILGLIARRKDWYRNDDTAELLTTLRDAGLFTQFARVTFIGASMGGFAALTYAALVPGAHVLAFSPQSTLAPDLVPFERRYRYSQKKWDWTTPVHRDAAASMAGLASATLVYDPFVSEDKRHAMRLDGPNVTHIHTDHMGHRAIRLMKEAGGLDHLIEGMAKGSFDPATYALEARGRRDLLSWQRAVLGEAERRGHIKLALRAAEALTRMDPGQRWGHRAAARLGTLVPQTRVVIEQEILIPDGKPKKPFEGKMLRLQNPIVVPERDHDTRLAAGVLRADGAYCGLSQAWIRARKPTPAPSLSVEETVGHLPGRHLFAGHFRGHFGHFLVESTARLWALDHLKQPLDSILYLPYRGQIGPVERAIEGHEGFFKLLGIDTPLRAIPTAMRVDELIVPELGFGWELRYAGSPAYRQFMQSRLNRVPAAGGEKLYISRAKLPAQRGGILGETVIEENLARLGYDIFHPERHSVEDQIARYRAAKSIIALDGSALHLAAYVVPRDARVTMILRRSRANAADYIRQYKSFAGITPAVIDVITRDWVAGTADRVDFRSVGEIDFARLFGTLAAMGLVPQDFRPDLPSVAEIRAMLETCQDRRGEPFRALTGGEIHPAAHEEAA